jgi:protein-glutamine gamma-glutamyltransferase
LAAILAWRIVRSKNRRRLMQEGPESSPRREWPGLDSEFYLLEQKLAREGAPRMPGETVSRWIERLRNSREIPVEELGPVLELHYRYRFDPAGISREERVQLRDQVGSRLEEDRTR